MLQKSVQWFVDRLVERSLPAIGSFMASALQRMLILGHAEHHNQLEEQARCYEQSGKPQLAALIRREAESLSLDDPLPASTRLVEKVSETGPGLPGADSVLPIAGLEHPKKPRRSRKSRRVNAANPQPRPADGDALT